MNKEFFKWLTDPVQNGGGALMDFGCYGANLMTYLMHGQQPFSVTAVTQHFKPDIYPKVDDEATIIVSYPLRNVSYRHHGTGLLGEKIWKCMEKKVMLFQLIILLCG